MYRVPYTSATAMMDHNASVRTVMMNGSKKISSSCMEGNLHSLYTDLVLSGDFSVHTQMRLQDTHSRLFKMQQEQHSLLQAYENIGSEDYVSCSETAQDPAFDYTTRQQESQTLKGF